ncbi:YpmS family protein [Salipaludibacillus sp. HK11]|uniref:YpmS family protein n=1 Tax=Salipaludibacillus sp. HK11 TaxID=3394320 RepID=UPI0039FD7E2D
MNKWKVLFLTLIGFLSLLIVSAVVWLNLALSDEGSDDFQSTVPEVSEGASFTITTTKEDLNSWLQQELSKEQDAEMYDLYIDDGVYLETQIEAFGLNVPIEMKLTPNVTNEGNLELEEEYFHVGGMSLPSERVFQLISATIELPDWIHVISEDRKFYVDVRQGVSEEIDINIQSFDLETNEIELLMTFTAR